MSLPIHGFRAEKAKISAVVTRNRRVTTACARAGIAVYRRRRDLLRDYPPEDLSSLLGDDQAPEPRATVPPAPSPSPNGFDGLVLLAVWGRVALPKGSAAAVSPPPLREADASPPAPPPAPTRRPQPGPAPRGEQRRPPERLAPQPPADGRDAPDPAVVRDGYRWALFTTQVGFTNVPVALSDDLRQWSQSVDALPELPAWAESGRTWAPGVLRRDDGFVLYFAARSRALGLQCIGAATAATIEGPYTSPAPEPLMCQPHLGGSIDPQPFVDLDGTAYLLWKADANAIGQTSQLLAQALQPDGLALDGDPVALLSSDAAWEQPLIENPALLAADGAYLLLYSGGRWESGGYATGYALCDTPLGPCHKTTTQQPILASTGDQAGTGGASVMTGPASDHWLAYHAWTPGAVGYHSGGVRSLRFASLALHTNQPFVASRR